MTAYVRNIWPSMRSTQIKPKLSLGSLCQNIRPIFNSNSRTELRELFFTENHISKEVTAILLD